MNLSIITGNRVFRLMRETFDSWMEDGALRLSAALAYYAIFSIAPLLVIAIGVAGLLLGEEAVRGKLYGQLEGYTGATAAAGIQGMVESASKPSQGWIATSVGFITLMLGASGVFGQLKYALNTIWEVKAKAGLGVWGFLRERLLSFGMVLVIGFLLLTSLMLSSALAGISTYFDHVAGISTVASQILGTVVSFGIVTTLFALIFKVLPDVEIEWHNVWIGATVTALLFELGKFGLSYYLGRESTASSYGAAGSVVLLLLWVYYASCILLFGAEFTLVYARDRGHAIAPSPTAEPVTAERRAQQGLAVEPEVAAAPSTTAAPVRTRIIEVTRPQKTDNPWGALLATTAATFAMGLLARRRAEARQRPREMIRRGVSGLAGETAEQIAALIHRWR